MKNNNSIKWYKNSKTLITLTVLGLVTTVTIPFVSSSSAPPKLSANFHKVFAEITGDSGSTPIVLDAKQCGKLIGSFDKDSNFIYFNGANGSDNVCISHLSSVCQNSITYDSKTSGQATQNSIVGFNCNKDTSPRPICLFAGTLITMADKSLKKIEEIKVGDLIMNYDNKADEVTYSDGEENKTHNEYDIWTFENGYEVKTVHRHRFYNIEKQAMVYMDEWEIGQHAYTQDGKKVALLSHKNVKQTVNHYTLFTKNQNYFANGLLSGNRHTKKISLG